MLSPEQRRRSLAGVIAAMAVVNVVYGLSFPLLALVLEGQGVSRTLIGLSTVVQALAVLVIAPWSPDLLRRVAPSRLMQLAATSLAGLFLVAGLFPGVWLWFPLRFVIGALTALLWICSEALLNELAEEHRRGRTIGIYTAVGAAGFALGPLLLILTGSTGMRPFYATSLLILGAGLPLFLVAHRPLAPVAGRSAGLWRVFRLAPAVMLANIVYAASAETLLTFFPIFGMSLGIGERTALGLLTMMGLGTMLLVIPLGWLADRIDRLALLSACVLGTLLALLLMPAMVTRPGIAPAYAFAFGGIEGMIYTLGVVLIGERFRGEMLAAATTMFTACWGTGTVLGPLLAGIGMDRLGAESMASIVAAFFAVYLPVPVVTWLRRRTQKPA